MASQETIERVTAQQEATISGHRLWRNNRGLFYTMAGQKVRAGLEAGGSSDLIGYTTIEITPEMVGKKIAVFTAVEMKRKTWKKPTSDTEKQQATFIEHVSKNGGIAFFCNDGKKYIEYLKIGLASLSR